MRIIQADPVWSTVGNPGYSLGDPVLIGTQVLGTNGYVQPYDPVMAISIADKAGICITSNKFTSENHVFRFGQRIIATCKYDLTTTCDQLAVLSMFD